MSPATHDISVCAAVYRAHDEPNIASLARELPAAVDGLTYELVVLLNGIDPASAGAPEGARIVQEDANYGLPIAWNRAAAAADGRVLVFANDDLSLGPGSLRMLHDALAQNSDAGVVGPVGTNWDLERAVHRAWIDPDSLEPGQVRECDVVSGFLFATPAEVFEKVGGFDEAYSPVTFEEVDYCTAVRRKLGLRCFAVGGVDQDHEFGITAKGKPWRRVKWARGNEFLFRIDRRNRKHFLSKWA